MCCFISSSSSSSSFCECVHVCPSFSLSFSFLSLIFSFFLLFYCFHSAWQSAPLDFRHAFDEDAPRGTRTHGSAIDSRHITRSRRKFELGHCLNGSRGFPLGLDTSRRLFMEHLWRSACFGPG